MLYKLTDVHNPDLLKNLGISENELTEKIEYLETKLGKDLFVRVEKKFKEKHIPKIDKHMIYDGVIGGVLNPKTIELIELSNYLEVLEGYKGFSNIIEGLTTIDQQNFRNYFYQVAVSYRLNKIGILKELEPEIIGKTPDLLFTFKDKDYIGEVTCLTIGDLHEKTDLLLITLANGINPIVIKNGFKCIVLIKLKSAEFFSESSSLVKNIRRIINMNTQYKIIDDEKIRIEIIRFNRNVDVTASVKDTDLKEYSKGISIGYARTRDKEDPATYKIDERIILGKILIDDENLLFNDEYTRIEKAIRTKIEQLKPLHPENKIVLFVNTDYKWVKLDTKRLANKLNANILSRSSNIFGGFIITSRYHMEKGAYKYAYCLITNNEEVGKIGQSLNEYEKSRDNFLIK